VFVVGGGDGAVEGGAGAVDVAFGGLELGAGLVDAGERVGHRRSPILLCQGTFLWQWQRCH
jgi:hypothetical protein